MVARYNRVAASIAITNSFCYHKFCTQEKPLSDGKLKMALIHERVTALHNDIEKRINGTATLDALEQLRVELLGRQGTITALMHELKSLPLEEKRTCGPLLNELKQHVEQWYTHKHQSLLNDRIKQKELHQQQFDVTAYRRPLLNGSLHIYTHVLNRIHDIFLSMGFAIVDGPEVETDYYNFEALNIPADHPARESHDTFWLNVPGMLLRTHTSSVQAHAMEKAELPLAIIAPGRVYRNEATDATHDFMFTQLEGLLIDKNISLANLLAVTKTFLQQLFEKDDLSIRVRPGYFPFVEPGVEIDASCPFCTTGCSICKKTGWIELVGAGLVHPAVLKKNGIDPTIYSGFAFGFGIERITMIKYGINDVRLFHSSAIPFLEQF